jgi:alpha/beta superfamily hydrolase
MRRPPSRHSFGAWVALAGASAIARAHRVIAIAPPLMFFDPATLTPRPQPVAIVVGDRDEFCPAERLAGIGAGMSVQLVRGADHFLAGHEEEVARVVVNSLGLRTPPGNRG